jgi:peptidoglycan hydrolase-like protein with peptidoglycan-binding domain/energy-coupling factor transporter ATP-binding protein EcfA2
MSTDFIETFTEQDATLHPFPGLRPFKFSESHLFFGRDGQSERLIAKLGANHFLAVVGTSGSGKSSLVRAGLLPSVLGGFMTSAGSNWRIAVMRPGNDPISSLAQALNGPDVFGSEIKENADLQAVLAEATLQRGSRGLVDAVRQAGLGENENLLVVVDQFEELFRFARVSQTSDYRNEAAAFVKLLLEASSQRELPIYVVLTMRSDYLGDCSQFWGLPEAINESQYLIPRLTRDQLKEAMSGPISVAGGDITPRLVARLLNDVGEDQDQLPVLQHLLMRVWDEWKERRLVIESTEDGHQVKTSHQKLHTSTSIDLCCYEAVGGMSEALSRHADEAYAELHDERSREVAEKLFKALTEKGTDNREVRRPATLSELCAIVDATAGEVVAVVETFRKPGRSFLMPSADRPLKSDSMIDISHESLIRAWGRLREWVEEESRSSRIYRRLADTAVLQKTDDAGLYRDPDLQIALAWRDRAKPNRVWANRYHPEFELAMAFLDQSVQERDRDALEKETAKQRAKKLKRTSWMAFVFGVLFVASVGALFFAMVQTNKARELRDLANVETKRAMDAAVSEQKAAVLAKVQSEIADEQRARADEQRKIAELKQKEALEQKSIAEKQAARIAVLEKMSRTVAIQEQQINSLTREVNDDLAAKNAEEVVSNATQLQTLYRSKGHARGEYESSTLLASAYLQLEKYDEATRSAQRALEIQENQQIDNNRAEHDNLAVLRDANLKQAQRVVGYEEAQPEVRNYLQEAFRNATEALRVQEGAVGANNQTLIPDLASLAIISEQKNQLASADGYRERILAVQKKAVIADKENLAIYTRQLAQSSLSQRDYAKAITYYNEVLAIQESIYDPKHPQIIGTLYSLLTLHRAVKNDAEADRVVQQIQQLAGGEALLTKGAKGEEVKKLEQQLQKLGFLQATADEYFDGDTEAALIAFQRSQGLQADGIAGLATTERLENPQQQVRTRDIQNKLKELGFYSGNVDGSFGLVTRSAIASFQKSKGLNPDGMPNDETLAAMGFAPAKPSSATGQITVEVVAKMFPNRPIENIKANLPSILRALEDGGLSDRDMVLFAISTIGIETPAFAPYTELKSAFNTSPGGYAFDLYDNKKQLGNTGPPDGERYKGRGYTGMTGRIRYAKYGAAIGLGNQLIEDPDLANDPLIAARVVVKYMQEAEPRLRPALAQKDLTQARKVWNGGLLHLAEFTRAFHIGESLVR